MLKRRDIAQSVFNYLEQNEGYRIENRWGKQITDNPKEQRVRSLVAEHPEKGRLLLDCHGETTKPSQTISKRDIEDRVMTEDETFTCVSRAFHGAACRLFSNEIQDGDKVALCFPATNSFWRYLRPLKNSLSQLGVIVFLVRYDQSVEKL